MAEPGPPAGSPLLARMPALALLAILVLAYGGAAWRRPTRLALGSAWSEAPGHLWGLWTTAAGLWRHGPFLRVAPDLGFPEGFVAHLVDPVDLLAFLPGFWLGGGGAAGAVLGWNLLHAAAVLVAGLGALGLARALAPDEPGAPWAWSVPVAGFAGGAFLLGHPHMGRTEYLPVALLPWALAALSAYVRGRAGARAGVAAGLLLGGVGLGGSYTAVFAALLVVPLALGVLAFQRGRRRAALGRLLLVAGVAALCVAPMVLALLAHPPPGMPPLLARGGRPMPEGGVETLSAVLRLGPRPDLEPLLDQPPYPGVVLLGLAALGAALRPRRALGWLLLGVLLLLCALGPAIALPPGADGGPRLLVLPVGWLQAALPPLSHMKAWSRLGCLLPLPLGLAALHGVLALQARLRAPATRALVGTAAALAVLADQATWPRPFSLERPTFGVEAPRALPDLLATLPPGALIQLPLAVSVGKGLKLQASRSHLWQSQHGRPVTGTPAVVTDTALRWSYLARLAVNLQFAEAGQGGRGSRPPGSKLPLPAEERACALADAVALRARGVAGIALLAEDPVGPALETLLRDALGPPSATGGGLAVWDLARVEVAGEPCALPGVPPKVGMMLRADPG